MERKYIAYDECGRAYPFETKVEGNITRLTLKKEALKDAKQLYALGDLSTARAGDAGYYILPRNIHQRGDLMTRFTEREDLTYTQDRPLMAFYGIKKDDLCCLVRVARNQNFVLQVKVAGGVYTLAVLIDLTREYTDPETGLPADDIEIEVVSLPLSADYNDMARTERDLRLARGEIIPLAEKCKRPAVEYARKYPLIRIRMGWKPSPSPVAHQTVENEPEMLVACDFARVCDIADELKRQGVEGAELQLVGWHRSGHDGRFPQIFPADPRLGGNEGMRKAIEYVKSLGYRISTHTITMDAYEIADTFSWDEITQNRAGKHVQIGHYSGGDAYRVCPHCQIDVMNRQLPELLTYEEDGLHFTDVLSIVVPEVCFAKAHPCSTREGIARHQEIMRETRERFGAFSSEGCMDFALKEIDYGLYVTFGDGFGHMANPITDAFLPVWEVAYHGTVLYNPSSPTINYTIKNPADRLQFILRGGRPSMYYYSKFRTGGEANWMGEDDLTCTTDEELRFSVARIKEAADEYAPLADLQLTYMERYDILDGGLECATYANGVRIVGNFGSTEATFEGRTVAPFGYAVIG
ncbi:MAG: hypothetical protein IJ012_07375 [Clostridia bacterium]|nr:hypothetical protein [Clostridia bacterium]